MEWTSGFMDFRFLFQKGSNCHPLTNSIHVDKVKTSQKLKHTIFLQGKESHIFLLSLTLLSGKKKKKTHSDLAASRQRKFKGCKQTARLFLKQGH